VQLLHDFLLPACSAVTSRFDRKIRREDLVVLVDGELLAVVEVAKVIVVT
jgi:hypothetical protein